MKAKKVKIQWKTISNQACEKTVSEASAEAEAERIRSLPDVRTETVEIQPHQ